MRDVPSEIDEAFYSGQRGDLVQFCINESVEILDGPYEGLVGAVISIESIAPAVMLLVELGSGAHVIVSQDSLRLVE